MATYVTSTVQVLVLILQYFKTGEGYNVEMVLNMNHRRSLAPFSTSVHSDRQASRMGEIKSLLYMMKKKTIYKQVMGKTLDIYFSTPPHLVAHVFLQAFFR